MSGLASAAANRLRAALAQGVGAAILGFIQPHANAVLRSLLDKLREPAPSVLDFGAVRDGVTSDLLAFRRAFAASKVVRLPAGTYHLGSFGTSDRIIDLTAAGDGVTIICEGNVTLTATTTADNTTPYFFYCRENNRLKVRGSLHLKETNYDRVNLRGAGGFGLEGADGFQAWGGVNIETLHCENLIMPVVLTGKSLNRVTGVHIGHLSLRNCYYGLNAQNQGDAVTVGLLEADQCVRPYFAYGCKGHRVNISGRRNYGTTGAVNISRSVAGYDTEDIEVHYISRENTLDLTHVNINHIDLLGGSISGIRVHADIRGSVAYDAFKFTNYTGSGGAETAAASANTVGDIEISGTCDAQARPVSVVASYASKLALRFKPGRFLYLSQSVLTAFDLAGQGVAGAAAAWASTGTAPAIGNGSLSRNFRITGGLCHVTYNLGFGSTTTPGTGEWTFELPVPAAAAAQGGAYLLDTGGLHYAATVRVLTGASVAKVYAHAQGAAVGAATPFAWANADELSFTLVYPVS